MVKDLQKGTHFPLSLVVQAKALYVVKGMNPKDIGEKLGVDPRKISNFASRNGWTKERARKLTRLENLAVASAQDANAAFLESMALQSEELAEDGMQMARETVTRRDEYAAKDFASTTQGVKNLVEIFRKVRGLDGQSASGGVTIGALYLNAQPAPQRPLKTADSVAQEPALDVSVTPAQEPSA